MISDDTLKTFKEIWREEVGEEISDEAAMEEAANLLTVMNAVYRPIKKEWLKEFLNNKEQHDNDTAKTE